MIRIVSPSSACRNRPRRRRRCAAAMPPSAAAPQSGQQGPGFYRFKIGDYEVTAINDGTWFRSSNPSSCATPNSPTCRQALSDAFLPTDVIPIPFTTLMVNTGSKLIALDTGTGGMLGAMAPQSGTFAANLAAAGIDPKSVDAIYISHFHPDHINGIKAKDNSLFFPNASINVPEAGMGVLDGRRQHDAGAGRPPRARSRMRGASSAISPARCSASTPARKSKPASPASRHPATRRVTPPISINSGNQSMLYLADATNNPWLFVRNPEWQAVFDMDGNNGGRDPQDAARPRRRRQDAGAWLSLAVPGFGLHHQDREGLRPHAGDVAAEA